MKKAFELENVDVLQVKKLIYINLILYNNVESS